jgi:hypothetical protein
MGKEGATDLIHVRDQQSWVARLFGEAGRAKYQDSFVSVKGMHEMSRHSAWLIAFAMVAVYHLDLVRDHPATLCIVVVVLESRRIAADARLDLVPLN